MSNSNNSRRGRERSSKKRWKQRCHRIGRTITRSVLSKQKYDELVGVEDLPHRHEYSDVWDLIKRIEEESDDEKSL